MCRAMKLPESVKAGKKITAPTKEYVRKSKIFQKKCKKLKIFFGSPPEASEMAS